MGVKISELNEATSVQNSDVLPIVQNGETKKISVEVLESQKVEKSGDTMTGDLNMQGNAIGFGKGGNIYFKEDNFGDKFRIISDFNGSGSDNRLIIQSTIGDAGEDPQNWKDLVTIHADTGEVDLIQKTDISLTAYLEEGYATAYRIGNIVIVTITGSKTLSETWTEYTIITLNGVTAKYQYQAPIVDQNTGLCADITIAQNSNVIKINKRAVSSINQGYFRGQLIFVTN